MSLKWVYIGEISNTYVNLVFKLNTTPINLFVTNSTTILHTVPLNTLGVSSIKINGLFSNTAYRFYFNTAPTIDIGTAISNASITTLNTTIDPIITIIGNNYYEQSNLINTINSDSSNIIIHNGGNIFTSELFWKAYNTYSVLNCTSICDTSIKTKLTICLEEYYDKMLTDPLNIPHLTTKSNLFLFGKHDYVRFFDDLPCCDLKKKQIFEHIKHCIIEIYKKYLLKCPTTNNYQCYTYTNSIYVLFNGYTNLTDGYIMEQFVYDTIKAIILQTTNASKKIYLIIPGLPFQIDKYYNISSCELCKFIDFIKSISTKLSDTKLIGNLDIYLTGTLMYGADTLNFCTTGSLGTFPIYETLGDLTNITKFIGQCTNQDVLMSGTITHEKYYSITITNNIISHATLDYSFNCNDIVPYIQKLHGKCVGDLYEICKKTDTDYISQYNYNGKIYNSCYINTLIQQVLTPTVQWNKIGNNIDGKNINDLSGWAVSISADGTIIAVGAPFNNGGGISRGSTQIYKWNGITWQQIGQNIDGEANMDKSGGSVSLSADGTIVAIGAWENNGINGTDSGHVRIYWYNPNTLLWTQRGQDIDGAAISDFSGISISLSANGHKIAIGAYYNDGINGIESGHVRIYEWISPSWTQIGSDINGEAINDYSGYAVALNADGNRVAIGAHQNDGNGINSGHARIYEWNTVTWTQVGNDIDGTAAHDMSGSSIDINATGDIIVIGAKYNEDNGVAAGNTRIFKYNTGTLLWEQLGNTIVGSNPYDEDGHSVSLNANGNIVAIGSYRYASEIGRVRIYKWNTINMEWQQLGSDITGEAANDWSAYSIALSADGTKIAISAPNNETYAGHVRVYELCHIIAANNEKYKLKLVI